MPDLIDLLPELCRPPGAGWAVNSAGWAPLSRVAHERRFGTADTSVVASCHWDAVGRALPGAKVGVLGVPYDAGTFGLRGAASGPTGLRAVWDPPPSVLDLGDVLVVPQLHDDALLSPDTLDACRRERFGSAGSPFPVSPISVTAAVADAARSAGLRLVVIGGDHSISAPLVGVHDSCRLGVVHLDGHDDLGRGRHGVSLSHSSWIHELHRLERNPALVFQIGMEHDPTRGDWLGDALVRLDKPRGDAAASATAAAIRRAAEQAGVEALYVSIDVDCLDARAAPATGLPASDGLALDDVLILLELISADLPVIAGDVVEVAPSLTGTTSWSTDTTCVTAGRLVDALCAAVDRE